MNTLGFSRFGIASLLLAVALVGAGCSTDSGHSSRSEAVVNRPLVDQTAVEATANEGGASLAFFDDLENRPLASQDDAIHACLLLGTGSSAPTYEQRQAMAARLGYVAKDYDRPARQAVTMGEVATMGIKLLEGRKLSQEDALTKLVQRGIAPASARYNQGLTGAQLVSITGGLRDAMRIEGVQRVAAPVIAEPVKPVVAAEPVKASAASNPPLPPEVSLSTEGVALNEAGKNQGKAGGSAAAKAAAAETVTATPTPAPSVAPSNAKGHAEPLPKIPPGTVPPAIDLQDPHAKPSVIGPDDKVITPGQPKTPVKPAATPVVAPKPAPEAEAKPQPKPEPAPEPKPQAQVVPGAMPTMEVNQTTGAQASVDRKKTAAKVWVVGQPVRKTANAEESK